MSASFTELAIFSIKIVILFVFIAGLLAVFFTLLAKAKNKSPTRLTIKKLNQTYENIKETLLAEILNKKEFKQFLKDKKAQEKANQAEKKGKNVFVLKFHGDIQASGVASLREEISAILNIATPTDEVVVKLESAGGAVHAYGLAAAQLMRIRAKNIPLTVAIDKVAASGGYLMACVADQIISAPFAIIGSIGVIVEMPNFHRLLQDKHVDIEQHTAGEYKRTLSVLGKITDAGRKKLQEEIDTIHTSFKNLIAEHRQSIDINRVATGEYWLATQAIDLKLVDALQTSDEYLQTRCQQKAQVYEISYEIKKSWLSKFTERASLKAMNSLWRVPFYS